MPNDDWKLLYFNFIHAASVGVQIKWKHYHYWMCWITKAAKAHHSLLEKLFTTPFYWNKLRNFHQHSYRTIENLIKSNQWTIFSSESLPFLAFTSETMFIRYFHTNHLYIWIKPSYVLLSIMTSAMVSDAKFIFVNIRRMYDTCLGTCRIIFHLKYSNNS